MANENELVLDENPEMSPESETPEGKAEKTNIQEEGQDGTEGAEEPGQVEFDGDITKLPPEVQTVAKRFQADYTRKMQTLKEATQSINAHRDRLALLDNAIAGDPNARKALGDMFAPRQTEKQPEAEEDLSEGFKDVKHMFKVLDQRYQAGTKKMLEEFMQSLVDTHIAPMRQQTQQQAAKSAYDTAKTKYPDFDKYVPAMTKLFEENPYMNYEQLYKLATWEEKQKQPARPTMKPGIRASSVKPGTGSKKLDPWSETKRKTEEELGLPPGSMG